MSTLNELPPELLARAFEIGILTWGIQYLPPVCLVCHNWNNIVVTTPRLWGLITITRSSQLRSLDLQIDKVKFSPLDIYIEPNVSQNILRAVFPRLVALASNWQSVHMPTSYLVDYVSWPAVSKSLQSLTLEPAVPQLETITSANFLKREEGFITPPILSTFIALRVPTQWITPFLSSSITHLEITPAYRAGFDMNNLRLVPALTTLVMQNLKFLHAPSLTIQLPQLKYLQVSARLPSCFLQQIQAPNLESLLVVGDRVEKSLDPFLVSWSNPKYLPIKLHTLTLEDFITVESVNFFFLWLSRLPNLARLSILESESMFGTFTDDTGAALVTALSNPYLNDVWVCPSLSYLRLETDIYLPDLLAIARSRNLKAIGSDKAPRPSQLHFMEALLCPCGSQAEIEELRDLVGRVRCSCMECCFIITL